MAEQPNREKCGRPKRTGNRGPCTQPAGKGTGHVGYGACKLHGGSLTKVETHYARQRVEDKMTELAHAGLFDLPTTPANPADVFADQLTRAAHIADTLAGLLAKWRPDMIPDAEVPRLTRDLISMAGTSVTDTEFAAWWRQWGLERDRAAKIAAEALKLNLDERQVRVQEAQAEVLNRVLYAVLADAGLDVRSDAVRSMVQAKILEITGG